MKVFLIFLMVYLLQASEPRDVSFIATSDNTEQKYMLLLPENFQSDKAHDLLIALHGHGSDRSQFMKPSRDETRAALDAAKKYQMIYVSPDYRAPHSWMGPKAEADLTQIIEELKEAYRINRVVLCGGSMGATSALTYAALHPNSIAAVVAMNGTANHLEYDNYQEAIQESFGGTKQQVLAEYKLRSAEYWPEKLTMPIVFTASGKDTAVPPQSVIRLSKILKKLGRKTLMIYREQEGHQTRYADAVRALEFAINTH